MGALQRYLDGLPDLFDVSNLLDADVDKIESTIYRRRNTYKYLSAQRREFFRLPQLRFTQRDALNDPFEMTKRWNEVSANGLRDCVKSELSRITPQICSNTKLLDEIIAEHLLSEGLSPTQIAQAHEFLLTSAGRSFVREQLAVAQELMEPMVDYVFSLVESKFEDIVRPIVDESGVLSLTEDHLSDQMWAHYASQGAGFVIGLGAQHQFFQSKDGNKKNLLRKVIYTDQRISNFWRNPYYLFLVKGEKWAYEAEWRMLRKLSECDKSIMTGEQKVCLCEVPVDAITEVYFGYSYSNENISVDVTSLRSLGCNPALYAVHPNLTSGRLEAHELSL